MYRWVIHCAVCVCCISVCVCVHVCVFNLPSLVLAPVPSWPNVFWGSARLSPRFAECWRSGVALADLSTLSTYKYLFKASVGLNIPSINNCYKEHKCRSRTSSCCLKTIAVVSSLSIDMSETSGPQPVQTHNRNHHSHDRAPWCQKEHIDCCSSHGGCQKRRRGTPFSCQCAI